MSTKFEEAQEILELYDRLREETLNMSEAEIMQHVSKAFQGLEGKHSDFGVAIMKILMNAKR